MNEQKLFEGAPLVQERPLRPEDRELLLRWQTADHRRLLGFRAGCLGSAFSTVACFALGLLVPSLLVGIFGTLGFLGLGLWLLPHARAASRRSSFAKAEHGEGVVERYGSPDEHVDVIPASGRILAVDGAPSTGNLFGTVRKVGLAPEMVRDAPGDRRLSEEEKEEIRRLIVRTRRRWTIGEALAMLWLLPLFMLLALFVASLRTEEPVWAVPILVAFAAIPSAVVVFNRVDDQRLRGALVEALETGSLEEIVDDEGRRVGVLAPSGVVWTVDGQPSPLRTRWSWLDPCG